MQTATINLSFNCTTITALCKECTKSYQSLNVLTKKVTFVILKPFLHEQCLHYKHSHTQPHPQEEVGCPDQKKLVIVGKSASVGEKGLVVFPALET